MATVTTNGRNTHVQYSNEKETFPVSVAPTAGTITTGTRKDLVVGSSTVFNTDVEKGDFIWDTTNDELVEVLTVVSNTTLYLRQEFSNALSGDAFKIVKKNGYRQASWAIDAANTAEINGVEFPASTSNTYGNSKSNGMGGTGRMHPFIVDCTANGNTINVTAE